MLNVISFSKIQSQKALFDEIIQVFNTTLDAEGQSLWIHQFHQKSSPRNSEENSEENPGKNPDKNQLATQFRAFLGQFLPLSATGKASFLLRKWFHGNALLSSGIFGALLPPNNIVFFSKSQQKDTLTLEHASSFSSELALEWLQTLIQRAKFRAEKSQTLSKKKQVIQFFCELEGILAKLNTGLHTGSLFRKSSSKTIRKMLGRPLPEIRIPMDNRAYQLIDQFFANLNTYRDK